MIDVTGPLPFVDHGAIVVGLAAAELGDLLVEAAERGAFDHLEERQRLVVLRAVKAVAIAGQRHRFRSGSDVGNSETRPAPSGGRSGHEVMSITEAAAVLNVGERRMRQLAPALGQRIGGVWVLDTDLVTAESERRRAG